MGHRGSPLRDGCWIERSATQSASTDRRATSRCHSGDAVGEKRQSRGRRVRLVEHRRQGGARSPRDGTQRAAAERPAVTRRAPRHPSLGVAPETTRVVVTTNDDRRTGLRRVPRSRALVAPVVSGSADARGGHLGRRPRGDTDRRLAHDDGLDERLRGARAEQRESRDRNPAASESASHGRRTVFSWSKPHAAENPLARTPPATCEGVCSAWVVPEEAAGMLPSRAARAELTADARASGRPSRAWRPAAGRARRRSWQSRGTARGPR